MTVGISVYHEYSQPNYSTVNSSCDFVTNRNDSYFQIIVQLSQDIADDCHYFEITVVIFSSD